MRTERDAEITITATPRVSSVWRCASSTLRTDACPPRPCSARASALRSGISSASSAAATEKAAAIANTQAQAGDVDDAGAQQRPDEEPEPLAAAQRRERAGPVRRGDGVDDEALAGDQEHRPRRAH